VAALSSGSSVAAPGDSTRQQPSHCPSVAQQCLALLWPSISGNGLCT